MRTLTRLLHIPLLISILAIPSGGGPRWSPGWWELPYGRETRSVWGRGESAAGFSVALVDGNHVAPHREFTGGGKACHAGTHDRHAFTGGFENRRQQYGIIRGKKIVAGALDGADCDGFALLFVVEPTAGLLARPGAYAAQYAGKDIVADAFAAQFN